MKPWAEKIELITEKLIPWMLLLLIVILVFEFGFRDFVHDYHLDPWLLGGDYLVIFVFCVDLWFKYIRIHPFKRFLIKSWLDILVVFPFVIFFRLIERFIGALAASDILKTIQLGLHTVIEVEKETVKVVQEAEKLGKLQSFQNFLRGARFTRFVRIFARMPRFAKAFLVYYNPRKYGRVAKLKPVKKATWRKAYK